MYQEKGYSHRVAVIGYLIDEERILLLKRRKPPQIWAPPGGHLLTDEDPRKGLIREFWEETGLKIEVLAPVEVWFGKLGGRAVLSIDFLVKKTGGQLRLSAEHEAARWFARGELNKHFPPAPGPSAQFSVQDFEKAFRVHALLYGK
ncbi:MAG: NUDIX domain-containing protein [Calditrichaeota bacterium]|nr:MAG: NUDIX domain-containing protein [Calditrichota bacterium]